MPADPEQKVAAIALKAWHIVLVLVLQVTALGIAYGRLTQQITDLTERMQKIENDKLIGRDEFNSWREEMRANFDRLERELFDKTLDAK